jgi:hypothetical protein
MIQEFHASGKGRARVYREGKLIYDSGWIKNLLTNGAIVNGFLVAGIRQSGLTCVTYTDTTPNFDDMNGTYSQSGTTLARAMGTGVFASGDVGKEVKFGTGERCHIVTFGSTTSVTVSKSQTVAATTLRRYGGTIFNSTAGASASAAATFATTSSLTTGLWQGTHSCTFSPAVSGYTVGSISMSTFARVVLPTPVVLATGDQLQFNYIVQVQAGSRVQYTTTASSIFSGYPYAFGIASITGSGTAFTVTTAETHNFSTGDAINLNNIVPLRKAITSISSNSTTWTVIAPSHGLSATNAIVHEGVSVAGYNGSWTVASVIDGNTYTVTNASNPGAATGGTQRLATPGTYFGGAWTVASGTPGTTTLTVTSSITGPAVDTSGTATAKDEAKVDMWGAIFGSVTTSMACAAFQESSQFTVPAVDTSGAPVGGTPVNGSISASPAFGTVVAATYQNDWLCSETPAAAANWSAGGSDVLRVKQIYVSFADTGGPTPQDRFAITFTTPMVKKAAYRMNYPTFYKRLLRDLP